MKKYCNLFLLLFFLLFLGNTAWCAKADKVAHAAHINTTHHVLGHALPKTSMEKKKPARGYTAILFRLGIEGKGIIIPCKATMGICSGYPISSKIILNNSRVKYLLSFPDFFALSPEFLSSLSPHAPPALC